jgi:hypothetical protein
MSKLKSEIRKAVNNNTKYTAIKVWNPVIDEYMSDEITMTIEINVRKKQVKKIRK